MNNHLHTPTLTMTFAGALTGNSIHAIRGQVETITELRVTTLVLDLSDVEMLDPSGVAFLVALFRRTRANGGRTYLRGVHGQPERCLDALHLRQALPSWSLQSQQPKQREAA